MDPLAVVVLTLLLPSTAWCILHLGVSCVDHNNIRIGAITHNSNRGNFSNNSYNNSSNSNSSTVLLPHHYSWLQSGHHSRLQTITLCALTAGSWDISPVSA
jgi:hypothetical protein